MCSRSPLLVEGVGIVLDELQQPVSIVVTSFSFRLLQEVSKVSEACRKLVTESYDPGYQALRRPDCVLPSMYCTPGVWGRGSLLSLFSRRLFFLCVSRNLPTLSPGETEINAHNQFVAGVLVPISTLIGHALNKKKLTAGFLGKFPRLGRSLGRRVGRG